MDLLALSYFRAVARHEHISRAADELRVAQPSVSRTISRLESELGVPLFDRHGRRVRLNRFGAAFLRRVERALSELDDARRELADAAGLEHGTVCVAAETLRALTGMLRAFLTQHPSVDLRLVESDTDAMARRLRDGEVDLCFASRTLTGPALRSTTVLHEEVLLAVPYDHPLAAHDRIPVHALETERLITTHPGHWLRDLTDDLFATAGLDPHIVCEVNEPTVMLDLISAGLGIGLGPAVARSADPRTSLRWCHLDVPDCHRTLAVVWRQDAYLSTAATRLRDFATSSSAFNGS